MIFNSAKYTKRIEELETELGDKDSVIQTLKQEISGYRKTIAAFPGVKEDYEERVEALKQEYEAKVEKLEKEVKTTKKSVAQQVNIELAAIGIPIGEAPKEENNSGPDTSSSEIMEKLNSLTGNERTEYYRKNEGKILHALRTLSKH